MVVRFNIKKFFCSILIIFSGQRSFLLLMEIEYFYSLKTISFIIFRNIWLKYFSSQMLNAYLVKDCPKSALWSAVKLHNHILYTDKFNSIGFWSKKQKLCVEVAIVKLHWQCVSKMKQRAFWEDNCWMKLVFSRESDSRDSVVSSFVRLFVTLF